MARKKAYMDIHQKNCENEAKKFVQDWYKDRNIVIDPNSIYVVWFAFLKNGFKCMISSHMYKNNFFEITSNKTTGEICCSCFERFEYVVHPANRAQTFDISDKPTAFYSEFIVD